MVHQNKSSSGGASSRGAVEDVLKQALENPNLSEHNKERLQRMLLHDLKQRQNISTTTQAKSNVSDNKFIDLSSKYKKLDFSENGEVDEQIFNYFKSTINATEIKTSGVYYIVIKLKGNIYGDSYRVLLIHITKGQGFHYVIESIYSIKVNLKNNAFTITPKHLQSLIVNVTTKEYANTINMNTSFGKSYFNGTNLLLENKLSQLKEIVKGKNIFLEKLSVPSLKNGGRHTRRYHKQKCTQKKRKH